MHILYFNKTEFIYPFINLIYSPIKSAYQYKIFIDFIGLVN